MIFSAEQDAAERMSIVHSACIVFVATLLSAAMLATGAASAMEIRQFDKISQDDRAKYVSELISGAEKVLTAESKADQAEKMAEGLSLRRGP